MSGAGLGLVLPPPPLLLLVYTLLPLLHAAGLHDNRAALTLFYRFIYFLFIFLNLSNPTYYNSQGGEHTGKKIHNYNKVIT